jgi:membrane dipeptidase
MNATSPSTLARARSLCADGPVFDAHVDALQRALDLGHDLTVRTPGQLDFERGREGGLGAVVLACWVDGSYAHGSAVARADALLDAGHALLAREEARLVLVRTAAELDRVRDAGRVACLFGIEGGHAIDESIAQLERFAERGVRVLTLVWNNHLSWIRSCQPGAGAGVPEGLSDFGREVVGAMNRLGMVVDLSHAGERSFYDALQASSASPIASHSGCRALHDHPRNLTDAQLVALGAAGGVVGIVFHPGFLDAQARAEEVRVRAQVGYREIADENGTARFLRQSEYVQRRAAPFAIERVVDHIEHALEFAGPEHVGLGSDFDGIERGPVGLEDVSGYPRLAAAMLARGFDEQTVRGVLGENFRRLFLRALP